MCRVLAVLLLSVLLLGAVAIAEQATQPTAGPTDTEAQTDVGGATLEGEVLVEEAAAEEDELSLDFVGGMKNILESTGFANATWQQYVMIAIACLLLYLAIVKQFEPLLLLPISFGMLLANLPLGGMMDGPNALSQSTRRKLRRLLRSMTWASPSQRTSWATPFIRCKPPRAACSITCTRA